ncbi:hypothetical protein ACFYZ8_06315 [Streptomyces sp. NPDC001668]|uniref:SecDF P1 head subdomain-containing protein n=1 Tax=unclassified Streptomyces TaxID=2593676 RepID=UPI0033FF4A74
MNDSTENPLRDTLLHDALHAHVGEAGGDAGAHLVGLADGALRVARRRQRLARVGVGLVAAAAVTTAWVAVADDAPSRAHVVQPAGRDDSGATGKAAPVSLLPVTSITEHACTAADVGYTVHTIEDKRTLCVRVDRARGMTDVRVTSAKAEKSAVDGTWQVVGTLSPADRTRFASLTGSLASAPAPRNEFAIVIDGKLWSNPYVSSSITGGRFAIAESYIEHLTSTTAHDLAHRLDPGSAG